MNDTEARLLRLETLICRIMRSDEKLSNTLCSRCMKDSTGDAYIGIGQTVQFCADHREAIQEAAEESQNRWREYEQRQRAILASATKEVIAKPRKKRWGIV